MEIRKAKLDEAQEILTIYKSLIGYEGCLWDDYYPSIDVVENDIKNDSLYLIEINNLIVAVAHAGIVEELFKFEGFSKDMKNPRDLARVAVRKEYQKQGLAKILIEYIEKDLKSKNVDYMVLTAGKTNQKALRLYEKLGYRICGTTEALDMEWYCQEKRIG